MLCAVCGVQLLRRIGLECGGAEVALLRRLAVAKGPDFLQHFSPTVGNPFANTAEWDYFRCIRVQGAGGWEGEGCITSFFRVGFLFLYPAHSPNVLPVHLSPYVTC